MSCHPVSHTALQYGPRAQNYVQSTVHRSGLDLDLIADELENRKPGHVLDLGCGGGHVSYRVAPLAKSVVACDITPSMLTAVAAEARKRGLSNISTHLAAAEALPFRDNLFDVVLCRYSTHHWHDMSAGLREAARVLKPGGIAIFVDVVAPANTLADTWLQTLELMRDPSHVRNYSTTQWRMALDHHGFSCLESKIWKLPMAFDAWIDRTQTPGSMADAIRLLQNSAPDSVRGNFDFQNNGDFTLEASLFLAER